ncbi:MAG: zinc ribbon domain-containing protein [Pseudomonadota bacterium]
MSALTLPHCPSCGAFHWPARTICPHCHTLLPEGAPWAPADSRGTVLARTSLHVSLDTAFDASLPRALATVALRAGPQVIAFAPTAFEIGDPVNVSLSQDHHGRQVLSAAPATRQDDN